MTGSVHLTVGWPAPVAQRARQLALVVGAALTSTGICFGAPLLAVWAGSQVQIETAPTMSSIAVAVLVLATVVYGLAAVLRQLDLAHAQASGTPITGRGPLPWLHGAGQIFLTPAAAPTARRIRREPCQAAGERIAREPLVLIDGSCGADRPWEMAIPHLEFGFEVLAGVLPRDGSIAGAERAMDRLGWRTAHLVARPRDVGAAVDLVRCGRARSLHVLATDPLDCDPVETAAAIADFVAFRSFR